MRKLVRVVHALVGNFYELPEEEQGLLRIAADIQLNAQAPYSRYAVGVVVASERGTFHAGCNVERCSFTQTSHAEQNAIDSMVAEYGATKIKIVALVGRPLGSPILFPPERIGDSISLIEQVPVPCGHCLQIIWENCFGDPSVKLIALAANGEVVSTTIGDAFPMRFGPEDLGVDYRKKKP